MSELKILDELLTKAALDGKDAVTIDRWVATKILMDLSILKQIRESTKILDRRDELEIKE